MNETAHNHGSAQVALDERKPPSDPSPVWLKALLSLLYGFGAAIAWGVLFGLISRITVILGVIGSIGVGFVVAASVLAPFNRVSRLLALMLFPLSVVLTMMSTLLIVLIPFVLVVLGKDPHASLPTALRLAWAFYGATLSRVGSSLIITGVAALGAIVGYLGRLNGLKRLGIYSA